MSKNHLLFFPAIIIAVMLCGCDGDEILMTDGDTSSGSGSSTELTDPSLVWSASKCTATISNTANGGKGIKAGTYDFYSANSYALTDSYISGGMVVAYGGLESGYSSTNTVYSMSCTAGSWNALYGSSGYIAAFKAPGGCSTVAVTSSGLSKGYKGVSVSGTTYCNGIWATSGISGGTSVSLSTYSGGGGPGGGPGGW